MFVRKQTLKSARAALAESEDRRRALEAENRALANQVEYLVRTIRDMDQQIFKMSQCTNWEGMRPSFATLRDEMMARKIAESKRIADILRPELISTYAPKEISNG